MTVRAIKCRKNKEPEKSYLFTARLSLWRDIEQTAHALDVSIAHLIRESLRRHIDTHRKEMK